MKTPNGLERYTESISFDNRFIKKAQQLELKESLSKTPQKLRESITSENTGWWVPISVASDVKKNGNGRIYGKKLWENVLNNQSDIFKQGPMLCDHPAGDSDGSPKDICGIWLDAKMGDPYGPNGDRIVYGLLVPSGSLGKDLQDHLQNGLKVGTSTSGFGKLMSDGETVNPDTYQIERLADWVLNPSASVWFSYDESSDDIEDRSIKESLEIKKDNTIKEKVVEDSKIISKMEEKVFRRNMESFLKEADNIKDPQERLNEFKDIKSFLNEGACPDLKEQVEAKIAEQEATIKHMLNESIEMKEELGIESTQDLKEKLTRISEDTVVLKDEAANWKKISEQLQEKYIKTKEELDAKPADKYVEFLKKKTIELQTQLKEAEESNAAVVDELNNIIAAKDAEIVAAQEEIKTLEDAKAALAGDLATAQAANDASTETINGLTADEDSMSTELATANDQIVVLENLVKEQRKQLEEALVREAEATKLAERRKATIAEMLNETKEAQEAMREYKEKEASNKPYNAVESYYESLYKVYGNELKPYERTIKKAINLTEAKQVFYTKVLQNLTETKEVESSRIPESLYISPEDRIDAIGRQKFVKSDCIDRKPQGWV